MTHLKQVSELSSCRKVSLCVMPQEHSQALRPDKPRLRKNFSPSYGLVISLTSTYMAETSYTSSLTMSHYKQCSRSLSIQQSPKWLQRMCMALQNYSLDIQYKKVCLMFIADALSHAYTLTIENGQHDSSEVEPYEKFSMKMDFLYHPKDCKNSDKSQLMTKTCSNSIVRYTTGGFCIEKTALQSLYLTMIAEAN